VSRFEVELLPFSELRHAPSITLQPAERGVRVRFVPRPRVTSVSARAAIEAE